MQNFDRTTLEILDPLTRLIPDKPVFSEFSVRPFPVYRCPNCHSFVMTKYQFCSTCGQALDLTSLDADLPIPLVLLVPRDQIAEVKRYVSDAGEIPACVDLPALGRALDCVLRNVEVPGNE